MKQEMFVVLQSNRIILLENIASWLLYLAAAFAAVMPILQGLAFILAMIVSTLTGIKLLKELLGKKTRAVKK